MTKLLCLDVFMRSVNNSFNGKINQVLRCDCFHWGILLQSYSQPQLLLVIYTKHDCFCVIFCHSYKPISRYSQTLILKLIKKIVFIIYVNLVETALSCKYCNEPGDLHATYSVTKFFPFVIFINIPRKPHKGDICSIFLKLRRKVQSVRWEYLIILQSKVWNLFWRRLLFLNTFSILTRGRRDYFSLF